MKSLYVVLGHRTPRLRVEEHLRLETPRGDSAAAPLDSDRLIVLPYSASGGLSMTTSTPLPGVLREMKGARTVKAS
ncbi:hypothetical protein BH24CHL4_BH24CHL4_27280 [soil metagenome]